MAPPLVPTARTWIIWGVGLAAYILSVANRTSLSAVGVDAADRFAADASTLSLFAVLQLAVYGLAQIPVGLLLDRFGARPVMGIGMALLAVGQMVMAFSPNVGVAIVARMVLGAGDAAIFPGVLRVVATWFPAQRAPFLVQLTGMVGMLGQVISLIPLPALLHATSWEVAFAALASSAVLFAVLVFGVIRNRPPEQQRDVSVDTRTGAIRVVRSSFDLRQSLADAWSHPGTRLGFWSHFTTPAAGNAFMMLWGIPFLTRGEGLSAATAALVTTLYVLVGMVAGPVLGAMSARHPNHRSYFLVLPVVGLQLVVWLVVIAWPSAAPLWLLIVLALALGTGGPASLVGMDHARTFNPIERISTASGIVNAGGFIAGLLAILFIGMLLDFQGAGSVETYSLGAFRIAFLAIIPIWAIGVFGILRNRAKVLRMRERD